MLKFLGESSLNTKVIILVGVLAMIVVANSLISRQVSQATSSPQGNKSVKSSGFSGTNSVASPQESSAPTEDFSGQNSSGQNSSQTNITVNGQNIQLPDNGEVHQTMTYGNTTTTVDAQSSSSQGQASNTSSSSINVTVNSSGGEPMD
jgi:hypothetical protein